jgi:pimeloyl-ACP methyl ester carboxylesterase
VAFGARIGAIPAAGEVLVSSTVKAFAVGSALGFTDVGWTACKGYRDSGGYTRCPSSSRRRRCREGPARVTGVTHTGTVQRDDGPTIAYDVVSDGPLVVFIHGLTSFRQTWNPITALLAPDFTCVRMDVRGHGASSAAPEYSMQSLVGDARAVIEEVGLGEPAVVGHSLGASIAAVYAAAHGARVVVCVDQSLRFGELAALVQAHADDLRSPRTMEAVLSIDRALRLEPYGDLEELERRVLAFPREVVLGVWDALLRTPPEQLTATAEAILPRIAAPLLSLHGSPPPPASRGGSLASCAVPESRSGIGPVTCCTSSTQNGLRHASGRY